MCKLPLVKDSGSHPPCRGGQDPRPHCWGREGLRPSLTQGSSQGHFTKDGVCEVSGGRRILLRMGSSEKTFNKGEILNVLVHKLEVSSHILQNKSSQFTHGQQGKVLGYIGY